MEFKTLKQLRKAALESPIQVSVLTFEKDKFNMMDTYVITWNGHKLEAQKGSKVFKMNEEIIELTKDNWDSWKQLGVFVEYF